MSERTPGVYISIADGIAQVLLHNPSRGNSVDRAIYEQLNRAWGDLDRHPNVRVIIFATSGERHFCTGADLGGLSNEGLRRPGERSGEEWNFTWAMKGIKKPVLAVVNGKAVGGGLAFVTDADIVYASRKAEFFDSHVRVGLIVGYAALRLASIVGPSEAKRIGLGCGSLTAERAHSLGLVNELFDTPEEASNAAFKAAQAIAAGSPRVVRKTMELMRGLTRPPHDIAAIKLADQFIDEHMDHPDFKEGPLAFVEKRVPSWAND